jgi:hypothetical protein
MLRRLLGENIVLTTALAPDIGQVRFDQGQCEQVLVNLAVNARDAMAHGGTLTIETSNVSIGRASEHQGTRLEPGDYVMLSVSDTGAGMTNEVKAHLFEPFFTTKGPGRGSGLGLAVIFGAVTQHGGQIDVSSQPGRGTSFRIYLPRLAETEPGAHPPLPDAITAGGSETIVLVEDDDAVRSLARLVLMRHGYVVHAFEDGASAIRAVAGMTEPLHLVVSDVVMPDMNGRAMAERLLELRPTLRVLFTSGYTESEIAHHGVLADGLEFIPKPYSPDALLQRVRQLLDGRER